MRLELVDVTAGYGDATVLRNVALTVPAGRVVALLGPNGAGKTTTLSTASGILYPQSGQVLLDGEDITSLRPHERVARGLCHVTEGNAVFPGLTVADNLRMFASSGSETEAVERAVDAFPKLGQRLSQVAGTMSGGEQRMLALARVYGRNPRVVLLDEISLGLAPIIVDDIFQFLERLAAEGASLLVVEQYVSRILRIADLAYILVRGAVAYAGEPREMDDAALMARYLGAEAG